MVVENVIAEIEIDGTPVKNYINLRLDQRFNEHHRFFLRLPYDVFEKERFTLNNVKKLIGKVTIIRLCRGRQKKMLNEFKGIIANVSIEQSDASHSEIVLQGYSPTIILESGAHTTCFVQKDIKKIAEEIAKELSGECRVNVKPVYTKTVNYFTQYRESNFQFLNRLAVEFGEWFYYNGKELFFGKPDSINSIDLVSGVDVTSLQLNMKLLPLSFKTFSYQSKDDSILSGSTPAAIGTLGEYGKHAQSESDKLFASVITPSLRPRVTTKSDLDNFLKINKSANASSLEIISGTSINPEITVGIFANVSVSTRSGESFAKSDQGKYVITSVCHQIDDDGKYTNTFEGYPSAIQVIPVKPVIKPVAETQVAVVKNNNDPDNLGRVKVSMLWQSQNTTTDWIRVMTPDAGTGGKTGKNRGFVFIPEVNDQVLVSFRHGDPDRPFVMGSLFHGKSVAGGGKDNKIKTLSTNSGNTITLDDDKGSMLLEDAKGNSMLLDGEGKIKIECTEQIELICGNSTITLTKDGTITIKGQTKVDIKSDQVVSIEGTKEVAIKGTNVSAKANANLDLAANANLTAKASASLALEGTATAKFSSGAMAEITAAIVKIN